MLQKKNICCLLPAMAFAIMAHAQSKPGSDPEQTRESLYQKLDRKGEIYYGMPFGDFTAYTPEGIPFSNRHLSGKVSLLLFWFPGIGWSGGKYTANYLQLGSIPALREQCRFFQIVSLLADSSGLSLFRQQHPDVDVFTVANLQSHGNAAQLNNGKGMPSCVLVDRNGKIVRSAFLGSGFDERGMADKIRELMLQ